MFGFNSAQGPITGSGNVEQVTLSLVSNSNNNFSQFNTTQFRYDGARDKYFRVTFTTEVDSNTGNPQPVIMSAQFYIGNSPNANLFAKINYPTAAFNDYSFTLTFTGIVLLSPSQIIGVRVTNDTQPTITSQPGLTNSSLTLTEV